MLPLPTPLPPIGDIVALFASIDEKLCISILEEDLWHLKKLRNTQPMNVKLAIVGGDLAPKF
jgi:hypothetical protein